MRTLQKPSRSLFLTVVFERTAPRWAFPYIISINFHRPVILFRVSWKLYVQNYILFNNTFTIITLLNTIEKI